MTLVVGAVTRVGVSLHADWRLSQDAATSPPSFATGDLKLWIWPPDLCVGYAGNQVAALDALRSAFGADTADLDGLVSRLVEAHRRDVRGGLDFIVGSRDERTLVAIKDGDADRCDFAWIGDVDAFGTFQQMRADARRLLGAGQEADAEIPHAFRRLIENAGRSDSVGELDVRVCVGPTGDRLIYAPSIVAESGFEPQATRGGVPTTVRFGRAASGGFSRTLLGAETEPAVGVYFPHGRVGYLANPRALDTPKPYSNVSHDDFTAAVFHDTGVRLAPGIRLD